MGGKIHNSKPVYPHEQRNEADLWKEIKEKRAKKKEVNSEYVQSKCPKCGNVDAISKEETKKKVHCQRCYFHYDYHEPFSFLKDEN